MPMQRDRYPANWNQIALQVKTEANWRCEQCGRMCRKVGESLPKFIDRVTPKGQLLDEISTKPTRFVLTTAHLDQNPSNCERSNLKALCSVCHLNHDRQYKKANQAAKQERQGQLRLFSHESIS